jgi:hypothetical protein
MALDSFIGPEVETSGGRSEASGKRQESHVMKEGRERQVVKGVA